MPACALELTPSNEGTRLRLRVKAGAKRNTLLGVHAGALKLSVTAAPEKGKANKAALGLIAEALSLSHTALELVAGASSQDKTVYVPLSPATVAARLS